MAIFKSKNITKDGRKWYFSVRYKNAHGEKMRKKSGNFATKQEAEKAERQFINDKNDIKIAMTFEEMYNRYLDYVTESIKGSTLFNKRNRIKNHVLNYFGNMNIHNITVNTVLDWKAKINKATAKTGETYRLSYKQGLFAELRTILKYGVKFCGLKENVTDKVKTFQDKNEAVISDEEKFRYITPDEYNLFTSVIDNLVYKVFFAFLYYMGVRKGEAQALNWDDILWDSSKVRIIKTITEMTDERDEYGKRFKITNTKNRKNRTIQMPPILKNLLLELYNYYSEYEGFNHQWFVFGGNRHLPTHSITICKDRYFNLVKEKYGIAINRITSHQFRHSHASYLISSGIKPDVIAYRLGDTVAVVLKVYAHLYPEVEDEIIETLDLVENGYVIKKKILLPNTKKEILKIN